MGCCPVHTHTLHPADGQPQEIKFILFFLVHVLPALRSRELINPHALENSHPATVNAVPFSVAHPEQKWVWVEVPPALAGVCYFPSPSLIGRCEVVLGEFLKEIKKNPSSVKFAEMANILVIHCQTTGECEGPMATAISSEAERALVGV